MNAHDGGRQQLDAASVLNARTTLVQLLARAGVYSGDAEELIGLIEAGALSLAHQEVDGLARDAPSGKGELYGSGWLDGARAAADGLGGIAEHALRQAVAAGVPERSADDRPRVGRMELERAKVAVLPLYLSFTDVSDLDPEATDQVLKAVLATLTSRQRAGYPGRLTEFAALHRARLERLFGEFGPGSAIAIHGRYSLVHSPTSLAVLERLLGDPAPLREEWDAAELPPAWLDGLTTAWERSEAG
ncbi:hypothetical protein [Streptomyces showdoensis]|uniref:Uncharacterized protein n=1 Tax=Streptomyces showdoensis TaxID=68268 RepID=A0A2P2GJU0_STREW|nr:hypothetical protein [Streptomyces showdoensis]KKZ71119.1 hypothetical protein VO63_25005 [Streptomyces showdoensis]